MSLLPVPSLMTSCILAFLTSSWLKRSLRSVAASLQSFMEPSASTTTAATPTRESARTTESRRGDGMLLFANGKGREGKAAEAGFTCITRV